MSDGINPSGPSQPAQNQAYSTTGNQASKEPAEQAASQRNAQDNSHQVDQRVPQKQSGEPTNSSLAQGVRGAGPGEEAAGKSEEDVGRNQELEGEQMAAPGEGKVADAVRESSGGSGEEPGQETDLDRKKAEQAPMREAIQEEKKENVDVAGVLGQRGGPANPVD